jgi:hypothetical protein
MLRVSKGETGVAGYQEVAFDFDKDGSKIFSCMTIRP